MDGLKSVHLIARDLRNGVWYVGSLSNNDVIPKNLSPKAKEVTDAANSASPYIIPKTNQRIAAATIRALVAQCAFEDFCTRLLTASEALAIATELEETANAIDYEQLSLPGVNL